MKLQITLLILFLGTFFCSEIPQKNNFDANIEKLSQYILWRSSNARVFLNADEKVFRQTIFFENLEKINQFNQDPKNTFKMSLNQFSDMTEEEFAAKMLTSQVQVVKNEKQNDIRKLSAEDADDINNLKLKLKSVDWRKKGAVSGVRNLGTCGACWAYAASGLIESFNFIKTNTIKDFSEQQLIDCVIPENGYLSFGCQGGYPQDAISYSTRFGILLQSQYPNVSTQGKCKVTAPSMGFYPKYYKKVPETVVDLKKALDFSPVSVLVDSRHWQFYTSGVFNLCSSTPNLNYAVLLVGYDIFGNWIIKNQWGTTWGEAGYMRLKSGNSCGILKSSYQITG